MAYIGSTVSTSPTIAEVAAEKISNGGGLAVKYNADGKIVLCKTAGEFALGIIILQTSDEINVDESVTIQINGQGKGAAGGLIKKGDPLTVDATGKFTKAATGNAVFGLALSNAVSGGFVTLHIDRSTTID